MNQSINKSKASSKKERKKVGHPNRLNTQADQNQKDLEYYLYLDNYFSNSIINFNNNNKILNSTFDEKIRIVSKIPIDKSLIWYPMRHWKRSPVTAKRTKKRGEYSLPNDQIIRIESKES